jgi:hypothetical protein
MLLAGTVVFESSYRINRPSSQPVIFRLFYLFVEPGQFLKFHLLIPDQRTARFSGLLKI